jgi:hypothetical protein
MKSTKWLFLQGLYQIHVWHAGPALISFEEKDGLLWAGARILEDGFGFLYVSVETYETFFEFQNGLVSFEDLMYSSDTVLLDEGDGKIFEIKTELLDDEEIPLPYKGKRHLEHYG